MNQRIPLDDLTSDQYDQLYDRAEYTEAEVMRLYGLLGESDAELERLREQTAAVGEYYRRAELAEAKRDQLYDRIAELDHYAALLRRTVSLLETTHAHRGQGGHDVLGANLTCAGCNLRDQILASLDGPDQPPTAATGPTARQAAKEQP
jgi:hypothetical protein